MGLITPDLSGIVDGAVGDAADFTTPINTISNVINGNLDNNNISSTAAIDQSKLAGSTLGYAQAVADQTPITTEANLTSLTTTVTVPAGGRRVKITAQTSWSSTVSTDEMVIYIKEGTTALANGRLTIGAGESSNTFQSIITPAAGSHTYKLTALRSGSGTITMKAAAANPAFILVELI
jgi:hypothetical protein